LSINHPNLFRATGGGSGGTLNIGKTRGVLFKVPQNLKELTLPDRKAQDIVVDKIWETRIIPPGAHIIPL
jgi:hypothetical protein